MLISICIPEYNAEKCIDRNIRSILGQTYENIELILYDDASEDNTRQKMEYYSAQYPDKIFAYYGESNIGIGASKNKALSKAKGDYVFFSDCDDFFASNYIELMVKEAQRNNFPDLIISGFSRVDEGGRILYERKYRNTEQALQQSVPLFAKLIKKQFLNKYKIQSPHGVILEDVLYQAAMIPHHPSVALVDDCGYMWVKNKQSATHTRMYHFGKDALENGFAYLLNIKEQWETQEQYCMMLYYVVQYVCWHLLRTGRNVGVTEMQKEYEKAFLYLDQYFPEYRGLKYASIRSPKGVRGVIKAVVMGTVLLDNINCGKFFFKLYSKINLGILWPKL